MTKCDQCGKGRQFGRYIRHKATGKWALKAPKKPRQWAANVQRKRLVIDGKRQVVNICTRCLRTMHKVERVRKVKEPRVEAEVAAS
ncbi:MAG: bL28 family ribosomal protein [Chloroflexota bacterium]|jgi:large subunit ribosomal protein L28|nr:bL28 family ribosomal protein [Chloroflexota bacterium]MDP6507854.1 bL28 family ribosomal protein [Chloroflexota bacterium]MDP6756971.1 bL28 family ribosomal protein [Chloroflexota bacterium]